MSPSSHQRAEELLAAINKHCSAHKGAYLDKCCDALALLLVWFAYLRSTFSRQVADRLLDAAQATAIEVAGCISTGLVRPAVFSIRAQLELTLAWMYYNDHPVEWQFFEATGKDYPMRAVIVRYLQSTSARFADRFKLLQKTKKRKDDDPYALLSVHVHSIAAKGGPVIGSLSSIVQSAKNCDECIELQKQVAEYLTDTLGAWYADRWHDLPADIRTHLSGRLNQKDLKDFCKV